MTPGFAGAEVDNHKTGATFDGGISDVSDSLAAGGDIGTQVKANIVEVGVSRSDIGRENNGLEDGVVG